MPTEKNLKIFRKDTLFITFILKTKVNTAPEGQTAVYVIQPQDVTGMTFYMDIKHPDATKITIEDSDFVIVGDPIDGKVRATITSAVSETLIIGNETRYEIFSLNGDVRKTYFKGLLHVEGWITS